MPAAVTDWKRVDSIKQLEGSDDSEGDGDTGHGIAGSKYSVYPDGLLIRNVSSTDEGGYICRARVAQTGQLEERIIRLKVILTMILLQVMMTIFISDTRTSYLGQRTWKQNFLGR